MIAFPSLRINFGLGLLIPTFTKVIQTLFSSNLYIEIDILLGFFIFYGLFILDSSFFILN